MTDSNSEKRGTRWDGYSNYEKVSDRYARAVDDALNAWAWIDAAHAEDAQIRPEDAAEARSLIKAAAFRLIPEMEYDKEDVDLYGEILDRWLGEDGFIERFESVSLTTSSPGWMHEFMLDIRRAGWEIGYLKAGRTQKEEPEDKVEAETSAMFT
ncbi:hypothetical protein [Haloferax sp. KTX1]|uniref:hypothetical protein n=1 Tax=Haloferax sp. KTX1 TaxID=2600597 RepID=UPI0011DE0DC4|nr:hypothetical protein [Haloferax sp. KTX1]